MKEIIVMGSPLILKDGIVELTEKQAGDRRTCLKPHMDKKGKPVKDCYKITAETCFKVGEVIGYAGDIDNSRPDILAQVKIDEKDALVEELQAKVKALEKALEPVSKK